VCVLTIKNRAAQQQQQTKKDRQREVVLSLAATRPKMERETGMEDGKTSIR
jgi:hypothetical protein